jgi:uncharacterized phage infection (PIP) family protein YhgE
MQTSSLLRPALALFAAFILAGCQSQVVKKSPSLNQGAGAAESIQASADLVSAARGQVNRTTAALRNLVDRPQDIPAQYKVVLAEITKLKADAAKISASADRMRTDSDRYLAEWARQIATIQNPQLRDTAFERRGEVAEKLQTIFRSYQDVKSAYIPYLAGIEEIQTALGADLSAKGLAAVRPFVAKVSADREPLNAALAKLAADFTAAGLSLQPGGM